MHTVVRISSVREAMTLHAAQSALATCSLDPRCWLPAAMRMARCSNISNTRLDHWRQRRSTSGEVLAHRLARLGPVDCCARLLAPQTLRFDAAGWLSMAASSSPPFFVAVNRCAHDCERRARGPLITKTRPVLASGEVLFSSPSSSLSASLLNFRLVYIVSSALLSV